MSIRLPALEKNILKYRALQMVLLLHQVESLRSFIIGSIRVTDSMPWHQATKKLPIGTRNPLQKALAVLVSENIITIEESNDIQNIIEIRNKIGHTIHELVQDISAPISLRLNHGVFDYDALERFERYRGKIVLGMRRKFISQFSFRRVVFEQAETTYKEELARLRKRIDRQYSQRIKQTVDNAVE